MPVTYLRKQYQKPQKVDISDYANIEITHPKPQKVGSEIVLQVERLAISGYAIPIDPLSVCIAGDT